MLCVDLDPSPMFAEWFPSVWALRVACAQDTAVILGNKFQEREVRVPRAHSPSAAEGPPQNTQEAASWKMTVYSRKDPTRTEHAHPHATPDAVATHSA